MSIRETFSNSIYLGGINDYDKYAVIFVSTGLWHLCHVGCVRVLWNLIFLASTWLILKTTLRQANGKRAQALLKSPSQHLYPTEWSLPSPLSWKKSPFLTIPILGLLVNTLAADEKNPVLNRDNLTKPIQMQLPRIEKSFSQFFAAFSKLILNFEHIEI